MILLLPTDFLWGFRHLQVGWAVTSELIHSCVLAEMARRLGSSGMSGQLGSSLHVVSGPFLLLITCPCCLSHGLSSRVDGLLTWQLRALHIQKQKLPGHFRA